MLENFTGFQSQGKVVLQWTMRKGESCYGTAIYRTTDGSSFSKIGEIPGECGNTDAAKSYTFTDDSPQRGYINQYFLELGLWGKTDPALSIFVAKTDLPATRIIPHPITDEGKIYFHNPEARPHTLTLISCDGVVCETVQSNSDSFDISVTSSALPVIIPAQIELLGYYITSENGTVLYSGFILLNR